MLDVDGDCNKYVFPDMPLALEYTKTCIVFYEDIVLSMHRSTVHLQS